MRNTGTRTLPNVAVTIDSFDYRSDYPDLAANKRPIWIVDQGPGAIANPPVRAVPFSPPGSGQTAIRRTPGRSVPLAPGSTRTFVWRVAPVKAGPTQVPYTVAAGLDGKAQAQLRRRPAQRVISACTIAAGPPATHVDPNTGQVVPGPYPRPRPDSHTEWRTAIAVWRCACSRTPSGRQPF